MEIAFVDFLKRKLDDIGLVHDTFNLYREGDPDYVYNKLRGRAWSHDEAHKAANALREWELGR